MRLRARAPLERSIAIGLVSASPTEEGNPQQLALQHQYLGRKDHLKSERLPRRLVLDRITAGVRGSSPCDDAVVDTSTTFASQIIRCDQPESLGSGRAAAEGMWRARYRVGWRDQDLCERESSERSQIIDKRLCHRRQIGVDGRRPGRSPRRAFSCPFREHQDRMRSGRGCSLQVAQAVATQAPARERR